MHGHLLRQRLQRSLRCKDACCDHTRCGECDDDDVVGAAAIGPPAPDLTAKDSEDGDSDDFDDDEEEAFMARMRASRLEQLRSTADASAQRAASRGVHARLRDSESLATALADHTDTSPIILHLASVDDDSDSCRCVEEWHGT